MNESSVQNKIAAMVDLLVERGVASRDSILGCNPNEIAEIESQISHKLPFGYREFLLQMGRCAGRFYLGTDMFYPDIVDLTQAAHELVEDDQSAITLPDDAIVFSMHQGYELLFIRGKEGIDPPVYYYMEESGKFEKKAEAFSEFLFNAAQDDW